MSIEVLKLFEIFLKREFSFFSERRAYREKRRVYDFRTLQRELFLRAFKAQFSEAHLFFSFPSVEHIVIDGKMKIFWK